MRARTAAEQLRLYRSRHVITVLAVDGGRSAVCGHCRVRIFPRRSGQLPLLYRHDPDEIKRLVKGSVTESLAGVVRNIRSQRQPSTEAGREWLAYRERHELWHPVDGRRDETLAAILAIEDEAHANQKGT